MAADGSRCCPVLCVVGVVTVAGGSLGLAGLAVMAASGVTYTGGACTCTVGDGVVEELAATVGLGADVAGCVGIELGVGTADVVC